ncbi:MAG: hypothetical protein C4523_07700 [Myxococcales bacterium]|nr:MAG: hypothetical protein C4523_07700 [Myxococcales bacterium]
MKVRRSVQMAVFACLAAAWLLACGKEEIRRPAPPEMPAWCFMSSGVVDDPTRGRLVIGVGMVSGVKSPEMARTNADGQARTEIAKLFNSYVENLMKLYQDHRSDAAGGDGSENVVEMTRLFTKMNVRGAAIEDRYVDESSNTWYAKAVIPFDRIKEMIQSNAELSEAARTFAAEYGDQAFAELDKVSSGSPTGP